MLPIIQTFSDLGWSIFPYSEKWRPVCLFYLQCFLNNVINNCFILPASAVPLIMLAYSKQSNSITVEFEEVSGATSYILRAENDYGFFLETVVNESPGTMMNLSSYTNYTLSVMSVNSGGHSQPSFTVQARTGRFTAYSVTQFSVLKSVII